MARWVLTGLLCFFWFTAEAAHTQARLVLGNEAAQPGETVMAGVHLRMDRGWHTYWKNPGASGMATAIDWELPPGVTAGAIQWPVPEKLPPEDLTTYVYHDEVVLLTPLKIAPDARLGAVEIKAQVAWLECEVQCLPGDQAVQGRLTIGNESRASKDAALLSKWQGQLPKQGDALKAQARWAGPAKGSVRPVQIEWSPVSSSAKFDFFPYGSQEFEVQPATKESRSSGKVLLVKEVNKLEGDWPSRLTGVLVESAGNQRAGYEINLPVLEEGNGKAPAAATGLLTPAPPLWKMLLYAFIGGLILNIMPCVLPVIALKILGFVSQARDEPGKVRKMGVVYALGVLVSFLVLAGLVIAVQAAGKQAGWGMQFGNPQFLVVLTILVTLVALNLFGLFEITPGSAVMDAAGTLTSKQGVAGAFFNGVLATILATPCTAPFLGAALGFAFTQSSAMVLLIFGVAALGLAAPYVLLSWNPAWLRFLPKPGAWMERFKVLMGFPMLATAIWLYSLIPIHYGERAWWLALFLVILALAVWIYGEFVQRAQVSRLFACTLAVVLALGGFAYAVESQMRWRSPEAGDAAPGLAHGAEGGIPWKPWSPEAVAEAREQGRPVLVDFTAQWCLTCKANYKFAINVPAVRAKLSEINAVPLLGDYTKLPDNITRELKRYGRAGVPLVLVYPKNAEAEPIVLPEALTPGMVLGALDRAGQ